MLWEAAVIQAFKKQAALISSLEVLSTDRSKFSLSLKARRSPWLVAHLLQTDQQIRRRSSDFHGVFILHKVGTGCSPSPEQPVLALHERQSKVLGFIFLFCHEGHLNIVIMHHPHRDNLCRQLMCMLLSLLKRLRRLSQKKDLKSNCHRIPRAHSLPNTKPQLTCLC